MKTTVGGVEGKVSVTCSACHRTLSDPVSVSAGIGPVCRGRLGISMPGDHGSMFKDHATRSRGAARSTWSFWTEGDWILVTDKNEGLSVTNDAENVVAQLARQVPIGGRRILYRDSEGRWDELAHEGGRFSGFRPVNARGTYRDAIAAATRRA